MFALAVHEDAAQTRRLLGQMQQARHSLLQAARTGECESTRLLASCYTAVNVGDCLTGMQATWDTISSTWEVE